IDHGWSSALHPEDVESTLYRWMDAVQGAKPFAAEQRIRSAAGEYRWFLVRGAPVTDETDKVIHWFGSAADIEDQKRVELAARAREDWLERALESSGIGLFGWELDTGRIRCSGEWTRLYQIRPSPVIHLDEWIGAVHPDDREKVRDELQRCCLESGCREFEYRTGPPDAPRFISTRAMAYVDDEGKPLRVIGASMDASERKRLEEAVR